MKIAAHRGAAGYFLENSRESFVEAIKKKADIIEADIRFSKDLQPIIIHDERLDRTTQNTGLIRNRTLIELQKIKLKDGSLLMTLSDFIKNFSQQNISFILDIKDRTSDIPEIIIQFISNSQVSRYAIFLHYQLIELAEEFRALSPELKLYGSHVDHQTVTEIAKRPQEISYLDGLSIPPYFLTKKLIKRLKYYNNKFKILTDWSIHHWLEDFHYLKRYENLGIDIVISEYPDIAKSILYAFTKQECSHK